MTVMVVCLQVFSQVSRRFLAWAEMPGISTARAAAGRRSGRSAGPRRRDRRVNSRRSWVCSLRAFSSEAGRGSKTHQNLQDLKPFAGVGGGYPRHEEAEGEGQHQDVQHEVLLVALVFSLGNQCVFRAKA